MSTVPKWQESAGPVRVEPVPPDGAYDHDLWLLKQKLGPEIMGWIGDEDSPAEEGVNDVVVNGDGEVWRVVRGVWERVGMNMNEDYRRTIIYLAASLAGKVANYQEPTVECALPWGQRFEGVTSHVSVDGPTFAIRIHSREAYELDSYVGERCDPTVMEAIKRAMTSLTFSGSARGIAVIGPTGSGKTTFMEAMFNHPILAGLRIGTIEQTNELRLAGVPNKIRLTVDPRLSDDEVPAGMSKLTRTLLRVRPDLIVIGEVRGKEMRDLLNAVHAGHGGGIFSGHADHPKEAMDRFEMLLGYAGADMAIWRRRLMTACRRIIWVRRHEKGGAKIMGIYEPIAFDPHANVYRVEPIAGCAAAVAEW